MKYTLLLILSFLQINSLLAQKRFERPALKKGNVEIPHERAIQWAAKSALADTILTSWANLSLQQGDEKVKNPRVLMAKLWMNKDLEEANKTILGTKVRGVSGSKWKMNPKGDYDFTETVLTSILYLFGDKPAILFPETTQYLLNTLLIDEGNKFRYYTIGTLRLLRETENHILMTEGSRYLKNRWLMTHGNQQPIYDNGKNGMEKRILKFLVEMQTAGLYEFNSLPYNGYAITALLNLEAFGSEIVRTEARNTLDYMDWCFALGSYQYKYFPPMRRRIDKAKFQELTTDYHSIFMQTWMSFAPESKVDYKQKNKDVHALMASCMPYRPSDKVVKMLFEKENGYFVRIGHGKKSCPEIYTTGKHFLLSAGGSNQGKNSQILPRPTMLFLDDNAKMVDNAFHISGPTNDFYQWNNTGVYENFACSAGKVFIPQGYKPTVENAIWSIFEAKNKVQIAVYSSENLGIMVVFENENPQELATKLLDLNPNIEGLKTKFHFLNGSTIEYDVLSPRNKWIIKAVDGKALDRSFGNWALIEGIFTNKI